MTLPNKTDHEHVTLNGVGGKSWELTLSRGQLKEIQAGTFKMKFPSRREKHNMRRKGSKRHNGSANLSRQDQDDQDFRSWRPLARDHTLKTPEIEEHLINASIRRIEQDRAFHYAGGRTWLTPGCPLMPLQFPASKLIMSAGVAWESQHHAALGGAPWPPEQSPADLVEQSIPGFLGEPGSPCFHAFNSAWIGNFNKLLEDPVTQDDFQAFRRDGISGGIELELRVIQAPRTWVFGTYGHPNIEFMSILAGELFEERLTTLTGPEDWAAKSLPPGATFATNTYKAGGYLQNVIGSVHQSYTYQNGVAVLALFNGLTEDKDVGAQVITPCGTEAGFQPACLDIAIEEQTGKEISNLDQHSELRKAGPEQLKIPDDLDAVERDTGAVEDSKFDLIESA